MQIGYQEERDYRRGVLEQGRKELPGAMTAFELAGSIASPINKILPNISGAPLAKRSARNMYNAGLTGRIYGIGNTKENTPQEYAKNIGGNVAANVAGNWRANKMMGRGGDDLTRSVIENGLAGLAKDTYNRGYSAISNVFGSNTKNTEEDEEELKRRLRRSMGLSW